MAESSIIELTGRIDNVTSPDIEARIGTVLDGSPSALVLDLTGVTFVSSIGLRVLLMAAKRCRQLNAPIVMHSVSPQILELFNVSGLKTFFPIYPTREAAIAGLA